MPSLSVDTPVSNRDQDNTRRTISAVILAVREIAGDYRAVAREVSAFMRSRANEFLVESRAHAGRDQRLSPGDYYGIASEHSHVLAQALVTPLFKPDEQGFYRPVAEAQHIIDTVSVDLSRTAVALLQTDHVSPLVLLCVGYGQLESATMLSRTVTASEVGGLLKFSFADGASFRVRLSVVWRPHPRKPHEMVAKSAMIFMAVVLPGRPRVKNTSFLRMKQLFAGIEDTRLLPVTRSEAAVQPQ